jgi:hypothetical protein
VKIGLAILTTEADAFRQNRPQMPLERAAWLTTVLVALATAVVVALEGYTGYAVLSVAVGASAAINLF